MFSVFQAELLKLKRCRILLLAPVCALVTALFGYQNWMMARQEYGYAVDWNYLFPMTEHSATNGVLLVFIVCFSAFLFLNEYKNGCEKAMFSYPQSCMRFVAAKLLITFLVGFLSMLMTFLASVALGFYIMRSIPDGFLVIFHLKMFFILAVLCFSLVPLYSLCAVLSRGYTAPLALIAVILVWNLNLTSLSARSINLNMNYLPWYAPGIIIQSLQPYLDPAYNLVRISNYTPYVLSMVITFIIPLTILVIYILKSERARI